jgi:hypothetical protein
VYVSAKDYTIATFRLYMRWSSSTLILPHQVSESWKQALYCSLYLDSNSLSRQWRKHIPMSEKEVDDNNGTTGFVGIGFVNHLSHLKDRY